MSAKDQRARELLAVIRQAQSALAELDVVPAEDTYVDGSMIRLVVMRPNDVGHLTYLLLKVGGGVGGDENDGVWYHTGTRHKPNAGWGHHIFRGWNDLMRWVFGHQVVSWDELEVKRDGEA